MSHLCTLLGRIAAPLCLALSWLAFPAVAMTSVPFGSVMAAHSAKCLAVENGSSSNGARIVQATCRHAGSDEWQLRPNGDAYQLVVRKSGQCLAGSWSWSGAQVVQSNCDDGSDQLWSLTPRGDGYTLTSRQTGMCLTVANSGQDDGTPFMLWNCMGSDSQTMVFERRVFVAQAPLSLIGQQNGQCMSVNGASTAAGAAIIQWPCNGVGNDTWTMKPNDDTVSFVGKQSGMCLDVQSASQSSGAPVIQWPCSGNANQRWRLQAQGNAWRVVALHSGQCLAVSAADTAAGARLVQLPCNSDDSQLWSLHPPSVVARWSGVRLNLIVPVAVANLPDGRLLAWAADSPIAFYTGLTGLTYTEILDPVAGTESVSIVSNTQHDMFCPGTALLPDGRIFVNGGIDSQRTSLFDPASGKWSDGGNMNIGRGYAGSVMNADGTVFTLGGSFSGVGLGNRTGELWTSGQGWSLLPGVPPAGILTADAGGPFRSDNHAWLHVLSGGRLLHAGPSKQMNWINPRANNGSGSITSAGLRGDDADSMNGSSVAYDVDQLLKVGGSPSYGNDALQSPATRSTQLIDASGSTPAVRRIAPMAYARAFSNAVALPNGQVVVVGGQTLAHPSVDDNAVMVPEIWDPATQVFERLPAMAVPRTYHSTAILLPDGRVWVGGGGLCGACAATHLNHEILTPPYLLDDDGTPADRPVITSVSRSTLALGDTLQLRLATPAASFALMRLSSVTHSVNSDQRRIPLTGTTSDGARYNLSLPSDPGVVTPGYYMVFAMNAKGTPSMAQTIRITAR